MFELIERGKNELEVMRNFWNEWNHTVKIRKQKKHFLILTTHNWLSFIKELICDISLEKNKEKIAIMKSKITFFLRKLFTIGQKSREI